MSLVQLRIAPLCIGHLGVRPCNGSGSSARRRRIANYILDSFAPLGSMLASELRQTAHGIIEKLAARPGALAEGKAKAMRPSHEDLSKLLEEPLADHAFRSTRGRPRLPEPPEAGEAELRVRGATTDALIKARHRRGIPRGYRSLADFLKPGHVAVWWSYAAPGAIARRTDYGLFQIDNRWVYIPDATELVQSMEQPQ